MVKALPVTNNFPMNELTTMPVEKQGVSDIHFGGYRLTIDCKNPRLLGFRLFLAEHPSTSNLRSILNDS
jgi:hypothetical protein